MTSSKSAIRIPRVAGSGGGFKKLVALLVVVALVVSVVKDPIGMAGFFVGLADGVGSAFDGLAAFFKAL